MPDTTEYLSIYAHA